MAVHRDRSAKQDLKNSEEEIIHEFHIIAEEWARHIKQLTEGVAKLSEKLDLMRLELKTGIGRAFEPIARTLNGRHEEPDRMTGN